MSQSLQWHWKLKRYLALLQLAVKVKNGSVNEYNLYKAEYNRRLHVRFNDNIFIGKRISRLGCNSICQNIVNHRSAKAKTKESILWDSTGCMEFTIEYAHLIICELCVIHPLYQKISNACVHVYTQTHMHIHACPQFGHHWSELCCHQLWFPNLQKKH